MRAYYLTLYISLVIFCHVFSVLVLNPIFCLPDYQRSVLYTRLTLPLTFAEITINFVGKLARVTASIGNQ